MRIVIFTICFLAHCSLSLGQGLHSRAKNLPCLEKDFPVMVHITVDSVTSQPYFTQTEIVELMQKTSAFFEPICMSFSACEINVIQNYTFHNIVDDRRFREMRVLFGKDKRLNIFIVGTIPDVTCGKSTFYGIDEEGGEYIYLETDGCTASLEGQLAHHLGHYFGLSDTYRGSDIEYVNEENCATKADSICDTPTDPFGIFLQAPGLYSDVSAELVGMSEFLSGCEFTHKKTDPDGEYYQPQVGNIMSAYPCPCGFTNGQFQKMSDNYNSGTHRPY